MNLSDVTVSDADVMKKVNCFVTVKMKRTMRVRLALLILRCAFYTTWLLTGMGYGIISEHDRGE